MKKTVIAFAALASFAGVAAAQSSVTLSGRVQAGVGKAVGSLDNRVVGSDWSGFVFSGVEDMGNGLSAGFKINPRINIVDGTSGSSQAIGYGEKLVFVQSAFGKVSLGTVSKPSQDQTSFVDAFGQSVAFNDSYAGAKMSGSGLGASRMDKAVRYEYTGNGLVAGVAVSDKSAAGAVPVSAGVSFKAMGFSVGVGHDRGPLKAANQENWTFVGLGYQLPFAGIVLGGGAGKNSTGVDYQAIQGGLTGKFGAFDTALVYDQTREKETKDKTVEKVVLGTRYNLSKRTQVFAAAAYDKAIKDSGVVNANKLATGYEVGVRHSF